MPKLGYKQSKEHKEKIRIKGYKRKHSKKTKDIMSIKSSGKNNSMYGRHHSIETKEKMRISHIGYKPHLNHHHTKETRNKISKKQKGKIPNFSGRGIYYNSPLQGEIYLRSSYEIAYAKYLDSKNILWMYEMETFDLGDTTYTPDFFLPKFEKFIEIKGYMTNKAQEKINRFKEEYPWDLEILRKEDLIKLSINL